MVVIDVPKQFRNVYGRQLRLKSHRNGNATGIMAELINTVIEFTDERPAVLPKQVRTVTLPFAKRQSGYWVFAGVSDISKRKVYIDRRITGIALGATLMHEMMHFYDPGEDNEKKVHATAIASSERCLKESGGDETVFKDIRTYLIKSMKIM